MKISARNAFKGNRLPRSGRVGNCPAALGSSRRPHVCLWTVLHDEGSDVVVASALQRPIDKALSNDGWLFTAPELVSNVGRVEEVVKTVACEQEGDVFVESALDHSTLNLVARADHVGQDVPHRMTREHRRIHVSFFGPIATHVSSAVSCTSSSSVYV
jgi:hypothetical protein